MSYDKKELERTALDAIELNKLVFIDDVCTYLPCSRATFYNKELDKLDSIKEALVNNKLKMKNALRRKWYDSDNATVQIALYKILSDEDELRRLAGQYIDHTTGGDKFTPPPPIVFQDFTEDKDDE